MNIKLDNKDFELSETVDSFGEQILLLWFKGKILGKSFNKRGRHIDAKEWAERIIKNREGTK